MVAARRRSELATAGAGHVIRAHASPAGARVAPGDVQVAVALPPVYLK